MSSFDQLGKGLVPDFIVFIISMYFTCVFLSLSGYLFAPHLVVGADAAFSTFLWTKLFRHAGAPLPLLPGRRDVPIRRRAHDAPHLDRHTEGRPVGPGSG